VHKKCPACGAHAIVEDECLECGWSGEEDEMEEEEGEKEDDDEDGDFA